MATENIPAEVAAPKTTKAMEPIESFDLTLDAFCRRLSVTVGSAMVGGFYHSQKVAGIRKASEAAFKASYDAFTKQSA